MSHELSEMRFESPLPLMLSRAWHRAVGGIRVGWLGLTLLLHGSTLASPQSEGTGIERNNEASTLAAPLRPPVNPRRNVDEFPPVTARFLRMTIQETNRGEPCLDELEVWSADTPSRNVALSGSGTKVIASGSLDGYKIHRLEHINDGLYGNGRSWISSEYGQGWVQFEFPEPVRIHKVVWSRDREGSFVDRLVTRYRIEIASVADEWHEVASSEDRRPLDFGSEFQGLNPAYLLAMNRFMPGSSPIDSNTETLSARQSMDYVLDTWQIEQGLPNNSVTSILQSQDGYLWMGTLNGLARFDGIRFVLFGDTDGLPNPRITCLLEDDSGVLWIGTESGVVRYINGQFIPPTPDSMPGQDTIFSLVQDTLGRVWVGAMNGLFHYENGVWTDVTVTHNMNRQPYLRLSPGPDGSLFFQALFTPLLMIQGNQLVSPPFEGEPAQFSSMHALAPGKEGSTWIGGANAYAARLGTDGQLTLLDMGQTLVTDPIWEILEASNDDVWIGTASGGLVRWRNGEFLSLTTQEGLSHNSIRSLCEDREGNLWVGTNGGGLIRLKERRLTPAGPADGLSHEVIMSMVQTPDGRIWIGTNCGGLNVWEEESFRPYSLGYLLDNECIWSLAVGLESDLWIGTWGNGLMRMHEDGITRYQMEDGLPDDIVLALHLDSKEQLWIGTHLGGLAKFRDGIFEVIQPESGFTARSITSIFEDPQGTLWFGTSGEGLFRYQNSTFTRIAREQGLGSRFVRCIYQDSKGVLWVGTTDGLSFQKPDGTFQTLTVAEGLVDGFISQIQEDTDANLWIGSNRGIYRLRRSDIRAWVQDEGLRLTPLALDKSDGLESLECTGGFHPAGLRTQDGELWFSTVKGIVRIDPNDLRIDTNPPPIRIESVLLDGHPMIDLVPRQSLGSSMTPTRSVGGVVRDTEELLIPFGTQILEIQFTALSLVAPERIRFRYRLSGLDPRWVESDDRRAAIYPHLPAGRYVFEVIGANHDGYWNDTPARFPFLIPSPFWQRWWFLGGISVALLLGAALIARHVSLRSLRIRMLGLEQEHALERDRARIAQDIHDDLGAGLTQIGWLSEFGEQKRDSPEQSATYFRQIGLTAREIVQAMDAIVWALNPTNDTLESLASYVSRFATDYLSSCGIRCRMDIPQDLPDISLSAEARHSLFLVVKEALHNIIKHSLATEVWIRFATVDRQFLLIIEDNGTGFVEVTPEKGCFPNGNGLRNMRHRIEELGGRIVIQSHPGRGTQVHCSILRKSEE